MLKEEWLESHVKDYGPWICFICRQPCIYLEVNFECAIHPGICTDEMYEEYYQTNRALDYYYALMIWSGIMDFDDNEW